MRGKARMMKKMRQAAAFIISLAMCLSVPVTALADMTEADAKTIKLSKIVGMVSVKKGTKTVPKVTEGMRMHDGHIVVTEKDSNAFFELDAAKYIKMDQISKVKIQKSKNKNKIMVESGTVFFNVTKPLDDEETMEIKTPTIAMGVRGTSGIVGFQEVVGEDHRLYEAVAQIYTGKGMVSVVDKEKGGVTVYPVEPGNQIRVSTDAVTGAVAVETGRLDPDSAYIPSVALEELLKNKELLETIKNTTQMEITEEILQQKKAEENADLISREEALQKENEAEKESNKDYGFTDSSGNKSDHKPAESAPDESAPDESVPDESKPDESKPDESEPEDSIPPEGGGEPAETNVLTGNITDAELLAAFLKFDQVILENGTISLTKSITIPARKSLVLEENGTLDLNGFDLALPGEIINNSPNSIRLGQNTLSMEGSGRLINNGAITADGGMIMVNGTGAYIKNAAGRTIPHIVIGTTGYPTIENAAGNAAENTPGDAAENTDDTAAVDLMPGKIELLSGEGDARVRFKDTGNSSALNYSKAENFKDCFNTSQTEIVFEKEYAWDGANWKLAAPENLIHARDYKGKLTAAIEEKLAGDMDSLTVVCGESDLPDKLEKSLTIPENKTLIIIGSSLDLDREDIDIINQGTIQIGIGKMSGGLSGALREEGATPGNIRNSGSINVINGILAIDDNKGADAALDGSANVEAQGTLKVYAGPDKGPYWGYISGQLVLESGSTIDLSSDNAEALVYLCILEGAAVIDRGSEVERNNPNSGIFVDQAFEGEGTSEDPYKIENDQDLNQLRMLVESPVEGNEKYRSAHYELTQDISLKSSEVWIPIGTTEKPFKGVFNGNDCTVSNMHTTDSDAVDVGFFGVIHGAAVENLILKNVDICGKTSVGGIAGQVAMDVDSQNRSSIRNCSVAGSIKGTGEHTGGIAGLLTTSDIDRCVNTAAIKATNATGGIAGKMQTGAAIAECYNRGAIDAENSSGGLVGEMIGGSIENSYNEGAVKGKRYTGGIIGHLQAFADVQTKVVHTYNRGSVSGDKTAENKTTGGIVGRVYNDSGITSTDKIIITHNALLGTVFGDHRIVGGYRAASSTNSFTVEDNYGIGEMEEKTEDKYDGEDENCFNRIFWCERMELDSEIWDLGEDCPFKSVIPTLKNVPEGQRTEVMLMLRGLVNDARIIASANQDTIAAAIEKGFEEEDLVTLIFEEDEGADLEKDLVIPEGKTLRIIGTSLKNAKESSGLNVPNRMTLTNNGTIEIGTEYEEGTPVESGVLSQGALGKNTIINHGTIDVKQGVLRISASEDDHSGIGGEIIVGQELAADNEEEPLASLMVYSGNTSKQTYWGKIDGNLTVLNRGRIDLFHDNETVTVNLLLLEGASITENDEETVYKNKLSESGIVFEGEIAEEGTGGDATAGGEEAAKEETAGDTTAGGETGEEEIAGAETGEEETAGGETGGGETAGGETGGEETAGGETGEEETAGAETGGEETAGGETGEEETAEEETGGEETTGEKPTEPTEKVVIPDADIPSQREEESEPEATVLP